MHTAIQSLNFIIKIVIVIVIESISIRSIYIDKRSGNSKLKFATVTSSAYDKLANAVTTAKVMKQVTRLMTLVSAMLAFDAFCFLAFDLDHPCAQ